MTVTPQVIFAWILIGCAVPLAGLAGVASWRSAGWSRFGLGLAILFGAIAIMIMVGAFG